jgi:hypothetical protein
MLPPGINSPRCSMKPWRAWEQRIATLYAGWAGDFGVNGQRRGGQRFDPNPRQRSAGTHGMDQSENSHHRRGHPGCNCHQLTFLVLPGPDFM